jgi:hypothetical protein
MIPASLQRDAADYETLRSAVQLGDISRGQALLPRGLAAWLTEASAPPRRRLPNEASHAVGASRHGSLPAAFASIVLRLTREASHA